MGRSPNKGNTNGETKLHCNIVLLYSEHFVKR